MKPVTSRTVGVTFDNQARMPGHEISAIRTPTLILHALDDRLQLFQQVEYAASHIPGAELISFEHGGHLLLIVEQEAVKRQVENFLRHAAQ